MTKAPKRIWARRHPTGVVESADRRIEGEQEYIRADLAAELVWAGMEAAGIICNQSYGYGLGHAHKNIVMIVKNPEAIAAIVAKVMGEGE